MTIHVFHFPCVAYNNRFFSVLNATVKWIYFIYLCNITEEYLYRKRINIFVICSGTRTRASCKQNWSVELKTGRFPGGAGSSAATFNFKNVKNIN